MKRANISLYLSCSRALSYELEALFTYLSSSEIGSQGPCSARSVAATLYPTLDVGDDDGDSDGVGDRDGVGDGDGDGDLVIFVGGSGSTFCFPAAGQRGERSELHPHLDHQDKSGLKMSSPS